MYVFMVLQVNGVKDDSGASLCSLPSTSGSMQSDQSNHSSNRSNQLRSSHSHSDNSTIVEVSYANLTGHTSHKPTGFTLSLR